MIGHFYLKKASIINKKLKANIKPIGKASELTLGFVGKKTELTKTGYLQ